MYSLDRIKRFVCNRVGNGYFRDRIRYLENYADPDDKVLMSYLKYCRAVYWRSKNYLKKDTFFSKDEAYVCFEDLRFPCIRGYGVDSFWLEFPDVLLPYILEMRGRRYHFEEIDRLMLEGPYELNGDISVKPGEIVFDCGANLGLFSAIACQKGAHCYSFEPSRYVVDEYLSKTAALYPEMEIVKGAVSDEDGISVFSDDVKNLAGGKVGTCDDKNYEIETISLDSFVELHGIDHVDFIKADIEGYERYMLKGAKQIMKEFAPKMSICTYHLPDDKEVLEKIVRGANPRYNIIHRYKKMYCWV